MRKWNNFSWSKGHLTFLRLSFWDIFSLKSQLVAQRNLTVGRKAGSILQKSYFNYSTMRIRSNIFSFKTDNFGLLLDKTSEKRCILSFSTNKCGSLWILSEEVEFFCPKSVFYCGFLISLLPQERLLPVHVLIKTCGYLHWDVQQVKGPAVQTDMESNNILKTSYVNWVEMRLDCLGWNVLFLQTQER